MKNQKGLSLYLSIIIMAIILSVVFGVSSILLSQLKTIKGMENSVIAFYAADTGIERVLVDRIDPTLSSALSECPCSGPTSCTLGNNRNYCVEVGIGGVGSCSATSFCIKSIGTYKEVRRAIEVKY